MEKSASSISKEQSPKVYVKKEVLNDEIKEFAETAMNELLGWYGYNNHRSDNRHSLRPNSGSNSSNPESPKSNECCGWCGKIVDETTALSSATAVFCSELCFSQSRRANFKKNKTCDWCRHVRHTVTYVDSQDGSTQLQFCSDKCLNQYKMHIFWRETRAHLEIHPHLHGGDESSSSGTLITPDLWMNKCKSPEIQQQQQQSSSPSVSPKLEANQQQDSPLPLITVTPVSKLMSSPCESDDLKPPQQKRAKLQKKNKRKILAIDPEKFCNEMPQDLRVRPATPPIPTTTTTSTENLPQCPTANPRLSPDYSNNSNNNNNSNDKNNDSGGVYRKFLANCLPPPTILLPYPIVLPLPVPIPLPIPLPVPNSLFESYGKTKVDVSSQTDAVVDAGDGRKLLNSSRNSKKGPLPPPPPSALRKRRKLVERKPKIGVKSRKTVGPH